MELINNISFYEDCIDALHECFGDEKIAVDFLRNRKYSSVSSQSLTYSVSLIKESMGDRLLNSISKKLGGSIHKIDSILAKMKSSENTFIEEENKLEISYIQLFRQFLRLKDAGTSKENLTKILTELQKIEVLLRKLVENHRNYIFSLDKEIDELAKGNNRRAEYYNLKRLADSAETKEKRAQLKYNLTKYKDSPEIIKQMDSVFGSSADAKKDADNASNKSEDAQNKLAGYNIAANTTFQTSTGKMYEKTLTTFQEQVVHKVRKLLSMLDDEELDDEELYISRKKKFEDYKKYVLNDIDKKADKANSMESGNNKKLQTTKEKCLANLTHYKDIVNELSYPAYHDEDINITHDE